MRRRSVGCSGPKSAGLAGRVPVVIGVLACVVLGIVGLVLPVIPGLLFLALAVLLTARHVPWIDCRLRAHRTIGPHMHRADRFLELDLGDKARVAGLLCAKGVLDGLDRVSEALAARARNRTGP